MTEEVLQRLQELELTPEALEKTRGYLRRRIEKILQPNEKVLICFPKEGNVSIGGMMEQVLRDCGCTPIYWGPDFRWMGLLRQAFESHVSAVVGPPLVVLGLMKMAKATATPLNIHNAFLAGYPYANWMIEGIKEGIEGFEVGCAVMGTHNPEAQPKVNMTAEEYHKSNSTTINHFYEKLFLLKDMMNTATAREMAKGRDEYMHAFVDTFMAEWEGKR